MQISPNTQSILLLTGSLLVGRQKQDVKPLSLTEYRDLRRFLLENHLEPADLMAINNSWIVNDPSQPIDRIRLETLLERGFLLSQAIDRWSTMGIWVMSRADSGYPEKLKARFNEHSPPVIYGCGNSSPFEFPGLAVVGSREVTPELLHYSSQLGQLAADAEITIVSGSARGVDQSAMRGALDIGGRAIGVLADGLEEASLNRDNRNLLMDGRLTLLTNCDPSAGFNVGLRMQRNKFIYAFSEAAVVVDSNNGKGGTWNGAIEQLNRLKLVPVYVRRTGAPSKGLEALLTKGALPWPEPVTSDDLRETVLNNQRTEIPIAKQPQLFSIESSIDQSAVHESLSSLDNLEEIASPRMTPVDELLSKIDEIFGRMTGPITDREVSTELDVSIRQARKWLERLVKEGSWEKLRNPTKYRRKRSE